jgi:hypothetical protein
MSMHGVMSSSPRPKEDKHSDWEAARDVEIHEPSSSQSFKHVRNSYKETFEHYRAEFHQAQPKTYISEDLIDTDGGNTSPGTRQSAYPPGQVQVRELVLF